MNTHTEISNIVVDPGSDDSLSNEDDSTKKRRDILTRRPSYRKILNDLGGGEIAVGRGESSSECDTNEDSELSSHSIPSHYQTHTGFIKKENDVETVTEAAPDIDNWEEVTPDPAISYVDFVSMDEAVAVCGEVTDVDIVVEVLNNNIQAEDEEDNSSVVQERAIPSAAEAMDHI
uniref:KID domain-containing protein n=1 Tax=Timema bartmani TaxID=61472 RepID=A0A7R9ET23_9NEOP|nr:unnamed protein product [Timema bartmani]